MMDGLSALQDEVALEGLDGITLPSLWLRLEDRKPKFPMMLDERTKSFMWKALVHNCDISFYEQPQEREDVELYHRLENIDPDTGIEFMGQSFQNRKDVYHAHIIQDNPCGIQGSCVYFTQRKEVTACIRSASNTPLLSLQQAWDRFGRKLVLVASQRVRFLALIGSESDPDLKLSDESYCVLERVGRARWQGELQRDLHNGSFRIDSRKIHYLRKSLVRHNLVTVQSHVCRLSSGTQQHSCLLMLRRFHVTMRSKYDILMERVSNILEMCPEKKCTHLVLRDHLNLEENCFRRLIHYMRSSKLVELFSAPLEELDPEAGPCLTRRGSKVLVRCIRLLKPYSQKKAPPDDDDDEDEEQGDARPEGHIMERDLLSQAYNMVVSSGTKGMTCVAIGNKMNLGKLERRMICRQLEREGVVKGYMEDVGRQRTTKFISHRCVQVSDKLHQFVKEHERNKLLCSSGSLPDSNSATPQSTLTNMDVCWKPAPDRRNWKRKRLNKSRSEHMEGQQKELPLISEEPAAEPTATDLAEATSAPLAPPQSEETCDSQPAVVTDVQPCLPSVRKHETFRLLKRRNLILEAIQDLKVFEGLFPLQKIITAEEKSLGMSSKCCKKTVRRLVHALAREGLVKLYTTTVIQDGLTRKLDLYAHPSIQRTDEIVQRVIDQIRFKMSSSYSAVRVAPEEEMQSGQSKDGTSREHPKAHKSKSHKKRVFPKPKVVNTFKPTTVRGLSKTFGYLPKMHRLRVIHNFLWYILYGHPMRHNPDTQAFEKVDNTPSEQEAPKGSSSPTKNMTLSEDEDETPQTHFKVYSEENSWKRYTPPVRLHKDYSGGWVMLGDLLLCLPLSVYAQVIQINYKVDGLEDYLNDPEKQHYLVRFLPQTMKRQLLYKRRYIFYFYENLQKLCYMGLIQFAPQEKFKDKDQVFFFTKRQATIVDTTSSEPHYWLVSEPPEKPFDKRHYTFNSADDLENYWFDLMCVCLNTPLGVIRSKRGGDVTQPSFVRERHVFVGMAYLLKGSLDVVDDGSIPGDGKGAGGLASEFFAHLKRNWLWTNQLMAVKPRQSGVDVPNAQVRLKSLCRNSLQLVLLAERSKPSYVTPKKKAQQLITVDDVQVVEELASRNKQVVGGKHQKRKRLKKEVVKAPRKTKEPKKRVRAHDERDHEALKQMTRQRVYWTPQEDSLLMLCAVATHLFNSKLKRPFVPYVVVRDVLHKEFETSKDKTSLAVGRRIRYILKNRQTMLNYRICLAEVGQDKPLLKLLEINKPENPEEPELCSKSFAEYIRLLRQKFSSTMDPSNMLIPDSKDQLFSQFKISTIDYGEKLSYVDSLTSTEDIHAIVLQNLIQSTLAMTNSQMKNVRSFQTFHIYSGYSQELLCQVFVQSRRRGLVNRRRITQGVEPKKNRALPILPMSYQLSHCYYRCFSWRFPQALCTDAFRFVRNLHNLPRGDRRPFTYFHQETENREPDGELLESRETSKDKWHKTPEESPRSQLECEGAQRTDVDSVDPPDVTDMLHFSLDLPGGACVATLSLMSLGLVSVYLSIPKQMVVVDSTLVDSDAVKSVLDDEEEDEEDGGEESKKMEVKAHHASHTKYLMMKGYCVPGIVKIRNLNPTDNIVVESCIMKLQLRDTPAHGFFSLDSEPALDLWKCGPSLVPASLTHSLSSPTLSAEECWTRLEQLQGYSQQDVQACVKLWETLDQVGERGMDMGQFYQRHAELEQTQSPRTRTLQQYMQDLQQEGQVVLVGAVGPRWVLRLHAQPWLITINTSIWSHTSHEALPFIRHRHDIPFIRKRKFVSRGGNQEPQAKRSTLDINQDRTDGSFEVQLTEAQDDRPETQHRKEGTTTEDYTHDSAKVETDPIRPPLDTCRDRLEKRPEEDPQDKGVQPEEVKSSEEESCSNPWNVSDVSAGVSPGDNVSFIARPWRMVDGKLNRLMCKGMMEAILSHIMSAPGLTQEALLLHYRDVLQPRATLELLQALIDLGCVKKKTLVKRTKASLFSRPAAPAQTADPPASSSGTALGPTLEPPDTVYYEPTVSCVLRLSQVLPHERHWNSVAP